jgi:hypothetical protein
MHRTDAVGQTRQLREQGGQLRVDLFGEIAECLKLAAGIGILELPVGEEEVAEVRRYQASPRGSAGAPVVAVVAGSQPVTM